MISFGIRSLGLLAGPRGSRLFALLLGAALAAAAPSRAAAPPEPTPASRARVLFLRVAFPDQASTRPWSDFQNPSHSGLIDRMVEYYDEASSRRFHIDAIVGKSVYTLPRRRAEYVGKTGLMIQDALDRALGPGPDSLRERIAATRPEVAVVFFPGPGAESDIQKTGAPNPWSEAISGQAFRTLPGVAIARGMVVAEDPYPPLHNFGVLCHEFGHLLGLPELYAPNKPHEGIGVWGLMGQGTWVGLGDAPPQPCAWSKLQLGWVDPILVDSTRRVTLPSVEQSAQVVKIWAKGPDAPHEYFLIENRQKIGADRRIPGTGLLVWHVDESLTSFRRSQDDVNHKRVDLLTADSWPSHLDLGHANGGNRGDAGDPYADRAEGPGPDTRPSTAPYDGSRGRFAIRNISPSAEVMTFDVVFEPPARGAPSAAPASPATAQPAAAGSTPSR